jgi:hypothetical protein
MRGRRRKENWEKRRSEKGGEKEGRRKRINHEHRDSTVKNFRSLYGSSSSDLSAFSFHVCRTIRRHIVWLHFHECITCRSLPLGRYGSNNHLTTNTRR